MAGNPVFHHYKEFAMSISRVCRALLLAAVCCGAAFGTMHPDQMENELRCAAGRKVCWNHGKPHGKPLINVQILSVNDFHGQITPGKFVSGRPVGSAPVLMAYLREEEKQFDGQTFFVHAGDLIGASVPQSALLQDEPTIMIFNTLTNRNCGCRRRQDNPNCKVIGVPGNHEFDEGLAEFFRMLNGGNHENGPFIEDPFRGAEFPYVCANITYKAGGKPILPPFVIRNVKGSRIAFIGATVKETPTMVTPTGVADIDFGDEADAINTTVERLRRMHVRAIVVLLHQGGSQSAYDGPTNPGAAMVSGPVTDIVSRLNGEVDVVISGHAHGFTNALLPAADGSPVLVTQSWSAGTAYGDIELEIDPKTDDIVAKSAQIITAWADDEFTLTPDAQSAAIVAAAEERVAPLVNQVIADASIDILRAQNASGESALGNLIADAQRAAMETDFAMMNPGGIRADLYSGEVTWGELYTVQPFNNYLVKMEITGQQVYDVLNQQWYNQPYARVLQISGLTYTWDNNRPENDRITEVLKEGTPVDRSATYTVTVNSFLAAGGDNFTVLAQGAGQIVGPVDLEALVNYIKQLPQPFTAAVEGRITRLN